MYVGPAGIRTCQGVVSVLSPTISPPQLIHLEGRGLVFVYSSCSKKTGRAGKRLGVGLVRRQRE